MRWSAAFLMALWMSMTPVAAPLAAQTYFVVHLPSAPLQAAGRQAAAVTALAEHLSREVSGLELEPKIFRRRQDAAAFLGSGNAEVVLMLTDASFLLDVADRDLVPSYRFVRGGRGTYRRLLVVRRDRGELAGLFDLRGSSISVVETAGASSGEYLARAIFVGEVDPGQLFSSIESTVDDFTAVANVVFAKTDAALVAEFNPLLGSHLEKDLRVVYTSPDLSLPILSVRRTALDEAQLAALGRAVGEIAASPVAAAVLDELELDGFEAVVTGASGRAALLGLGQERDKVPEVALPEPGSLAVTPPVLPDPGQLPFVLSVELPEIPLIGEEQP